MGFGFRRLGHWKKATFMTEQESTTQNPKTDMRAFRNRMHKLPPNQQYAALLERPDVMRVVRTMPIQDLFALLRGRGPEDSLEIMELLDSGQVQRFLDLDAWRGDRMDPEAMGRWISTLFSANRQRAVQQLRGLDIELLSLLLKLHTRVFDAEELENYAEALGFHSVSPDNRYVVQYLGEPETEPLVRSLKEMVEGLFGRDLPFMLRLLEAIRWEVPSSLEEEALRWREARLADLGFPSLAEARSILAYVDPDRGLDGILPPMAPPEWEDEVPVDDEKPVLDLSTSVLLPDGFQAHPVFIQALSQLDEKNHRRVAHELVLATNRTHAARGGDPGDPEALQESADRTLHTTALALSYLSRGDESALGSFLAKAPVARLFQVGHSLSVRLARQFKKRLSDPKSGLAGQGLLRLDSPLREVAAGFLRREPILFAGLLDPRRVDYAPVKSLSELAAAAGALGEAAFRAALLGKGGFGLDDDALEKIGFAPEMEMPGHGVLLTTYMANHLLGEEGFSPLGDEALNSLFGRLIDREGRRVFSDSDNKAVVERVGQRAGGFAPLPGAAQAPEAQARAENYARVAWGALAVEFARIQDERPDARFVTSLITEAGLSAMREALANAGETSPGPG
jgi:hypothetical protein